MISTMLSRRHLLSFVALALSAFASIQAQTTPSPVDHSALEMQIREDIKYLSSDELGGRRTAT
jgi:hypothetical protein